MITEFEIATHNIEILNNIAKDMLKRIFKKRLTKYSNVVLERCETHRIACERFLTYLMDKRLNFPKFKKGQVIIFDEVKEDDLKRTIQLYGRSTFLDGGFN